jgi:hypothetical protein
VGLDAISITSLREAQWAPYKILIVLRGEEGEEVTIMTMCSIPCAMAESPQAFQ